MSEPDLQAPDDVDVLVLPGVYRGGLQSGDHDDYYPTTTPDVVKLLERAGLNVEFVEPPEKRQELSLNALEWFLPVLLYVGLPLATGVIANAISSWLEGRTGPGDVMHLKVGRKTDEELEWFEGSGPPDEVLAALREWGDDDKAE